MQINFLGEPQYVNHIVPYFIGINSYHEFNKEKGRATHFNILA